MLLTGQWNPPSLPHPLTTLCPPKPSPLNLLSPSPPPALRSLEFGSSWGDVIKMFFRLPQSDGLQQAVFWSAAHGGFLTHG